MHFVADLSHTSLRMHRSGFARFARSRCVHRRVGVFGFWFWRLRAVSIVRDFWCAGRHVQLFWRRCGRELSSQ